MKIKSLKTLWVAVKVLAVAFILAISVVAWHLYQGGISLGFITPIAEDMLAPDNPDFHVKFKSAEITFVKEPFPLGIRVKDFQLLNEDAKPVASISEMKFSFSLRGLFKGEFVPRSVFLYRPFISIYIEQNGNLGIGFDASDKVYEDNGEGAFFADTNAMFEAYKNNISFMSIVDGQVMIRDKKHATTWLCPDVDLKMTRRKGVVWASGEVQLLQRNENIAVIAGRASFNLDSYIANMNIDVNNFYLPRGVRKVLLANTQVSMPLTGKVNVEVDFSDNPYFDVFRKRVTDLDFVFKGGEGNLVLPEPLNAEYDVEDVSLEGYAKNGFADVKVTKLEAKTKIGAYAIGYADVTGVDDLFDTSAFDALNIDFHVAAENIPVDKLKQYWPPVLGPMTYEWVMANISNGNITKAGFNLIFNGMPEGAIELGKVSGEMDIEGVTVRYLDTMPLVNNAGGKLFLSKDDVRIKIDKGQSLGLNLYDTELYFYDIWEPQEQAKMTIKVKGDLHDAMVLLDTKPMDFLKDLGVSPNGIKGHVDTVLNLQFPLRKDLKAKQVNVTATAKIKNAELPLYKDYPLNNADLSLTIDNKQMQIKGEAKVKNILVDLSWVETFQGKNAGAKYDIFARLDDEQRTLLGIDFYPVSAKEISGEVTLLAKASRDTKQNTTIQLVSDLKKAKIDDGFFGLKKDAGVKAEASATLKIKDDVWQSVPRFKLVSDNGITITGSAVMGSNNTFKKIVVDRFITSKNNFTATAIMQKNGMFSIDTKGAAFDATELFVIGSDSVIKDDSAWLSFKLSGAFDKVWLSKDGYLDSVLLNMNMKEGAFEDFTLTAKTDTDEDLNAYFKPDKGVHNLSLYTKDGGALIRALGYTSNLKGGDLKVLASSLQKGQLSGKLEMHDFKIIKAPMLAKLLSVASLTGILDVLQDEGLSFDIAEVPFEFKPSGLYIKDAHSSGLSIGLTAEGSIKNGVWNMEGSIIPAYVVNSLLGKIPLIGAIFSGGEVGGGLIAFKYYIDGPAQNPVIKVNPLSALTPGVTRRIFSDADNDHGEEVEQ